jgi:hypothetical protein
MTHSPAHHSTDDGGAQPRPLRLIAALTSLVTIVVGGLPTLGVPLTPEATGWLVGLVGALSAVAGVLFGERKVTPVSSPRASNGVVLTPSEPPRADVNSGQ